jgi:CheY-like chemotaxis protein
MSWGIAAPVSRRVLLVEDNPDGRETLKLLLELCGHQVEEAADGRQGVEKALAWAPEVAVVDIGLPGLDGYEVARRLRAALGGRVVLIALTAYGEPEDRRRAFQAGFDIHLTKPADVGELLGLLASV